ncbi:MAG: sulfotransferase, partial [Alteriqipengyuania sp.]
VMPSQALAEHYKSEMGIEGAVLRDLVEPAFDGQRNLSPQRIAERRRRHVTMINPDPAKGGLFFLNVVSHLQTLAPSLKCRAVEGRWGRSQWEGRGVDLSGLKTLDWQSPTQNMARIFDEASLLLVPSLWFEASARVIAEAQLAGVPVLAMRSGGIPEQMGDGGFLFDIPDPLRTNWMAKPPIETVSHWAKFVKVLMEDDAIYRRAVQLALRAGQAHAPQARARSVVEMFDAIARRPALASLVNDPVLFDALSAFRAKLNTAREAVNTELDSRLGDTEHAGTARDPYAEVLRLSMAQPAIRDALEAARTEDHTRARLILEQYLRLVPEDIVALGLLADAAAKQHQEAEARQLMERVVGLAPGFIAGHHQLVRYMQHARDARGALEQAAKLLNRVPKQSRYRSLYASLLASAHRFDESIAEYEALFEIVDGTAHDWMQYALALKTVGQQDKAVIAYRTAIRTAPDNGACWQGLSNMKLSVFTEEDIAEMQAQLKNEGLSKEDRQNIHFTLGKAFEDRKKYEASFNNYAQANLIRRTQTSFDVSRIESYVAQAKEVYTSELFEARRGQGNQAEDPVFVVGLHRAGSTLTEQILSSHSRIEGTRELHDLMRIGRDFGGDIGGEHTRPISGNLLWDLSEEELFGLGQSYLDATRIERLTERPLFVDKMPVNWMYAGLIHLILPNAKIIDIRRKPMAAGFALFKMNFGRGVEHAYDQKDIARYFCAYADFMSHMASVLPGRIHHIQYENLVADTESEIRRLFAYCRLPFEESCLRYWETERSVQTPSSEQVRKPIFRSAVEQWRNYEAFLGPLRDAFAGRNGELSSPACEPLEA